MILAGLYWRVVNGSRYYTVCAYVNLSLDLTMTLVLELRFLRRLLFVAGAMIDTCVCQGRRFVMRLVTGVMTAALFVGCFSTGATAQESKECADAKIQVTRLENRLKDWPAISRYRDANTSANPVGKGENRVVFMGDSITDFWIKPEFGDLFSTHNYIDRGISGQTTPQMLVRFRPDVITLRPKVVVILAGTNDIAGNTGPMTFEAIEDNLESMAELARANGIRVVFSSILPVSDYEKNKDGQVIVQTIRRKPEQIKALNDWLQKYSQKEGFVWLDYYSAMIDENGFLKADISNDGLHPNAKGYAIMSPLAEKAIAAALRKKK